ncbi:MAG: hypothetical protein ACT4O5_11725 [Gammaproteobacteria bacterium]
MNRSGLLTFLMASAVAGSAEPPATDTRRAAPPETRANATTRTVPAVAGKPATANAAQGKKTVSASASIFSSDTLATLPAPGVLYPDLVPEGTPFSGSCSWNESAGETCASQCPPIVVNLPFGTKNASNRALNAPGIVKVFRRETGTFVGNYPFNGLPAKGLYKPVSVKRLIVRCHPPGQASSGRCHRLRTTSSSRRPPPK